MAKKYVAKKYVARKYLVGKYAAFLLIFVLSLLLPAGESAAQGEVEMSDAGWQAFPAAVDSSLPFTGPPFKISERSSAESQPAIAYNPVDREFLVVWANYWDQVGWDVYAQRISNDGRLLSWFYVGDGLYPEVAYNPVNNSYLVVYERVEDIFARRVTNQGPSGAEFPIVTGILEQQRPAVAYNRHPIFQNFMVVWEIVDPQSGSPIYTIQAQRVAGLPQGGPGGSELIGATLDVSKSTKDTGSPDIAYNLNRNEYLVVYEQESSPASSVFDVIGRRITGDAVLLPEQTIDASANQQRSPRVAAYSPDHAMPYLVVFEDSWNDPTGDVRGYLLNGDGQPMNLVNVSATPNISESYADVASSEELGGYTAIWLKTDGDMHLWTRRIAHDGTLGPEYRVSESPVDPVNFSECAVANGVPLSLITWEQKVPQVRDLAGRLVGYRVNLPVIIQQ